MIKTRCKFNNYVDLWPHELLAITAYMERNDTTALEEIIRHDPHAPTQDNRPRGIKSQGMRCIIADIVSGRLTRKADKKPSTELRDFKIYIRVDDLITDGYNKTSSTSEPCALSIAAEEFKEEFNISEDVADKAYQRFQKIMGGADYKKTQKILHDAARIKHKKRTNRGDK